ncbi:hypothetical protein BaRGS_00020277 [Batillaria attramentaria]|uniref:SOCS box domain-containing protein n=1 Tax=Batillaria attramentaria TaxID=370345 RepID=A0ABD0KMU8_9CAEN
MNSPLRLLSSLAVETKDPHFRLLEAVVNDDFNTAEHLLTEQRVNPNAENHRFSVICIAAREGRERILNLLLEHGGDPDQFDMSDHMWLRHPIHWASSNGHLECLKLLLDKGVDINSQDSDERTALHWAATYGRANIVEYLLREGAFSVAHFLITVGANIDTTSNTGQTPLYLAALRGEDKILHLMIEAGCKVTSEVIAVAPQASSLLEQIEFLATNPRLLRELCCIRIRHILGPTVVDDVSVLPIPDSLKDIITLKHTCK